MGDEARDSGAVWTDRREPWVQRKDDVRSPYACDLDRVLRSRSFRCLQGKTQVLSPERAGLHRTRLTHSMEVSLIAVEIMHQVAGDLELGEPAPDLYESLAHLPPSDLVRTIASSHDLGHPPFGHDGETALDACMAAHGGFEGNGHTLRVLSRLETSSRDAGANLTRRAMLGVLKYPVRAGLLGWRGCSPVKGYFDCEQDVVDWILDPLSRNDRDLLGAIEVRGGQPRTVHRSLDSSIVDVADDVAYGAHDLEDALALGAIDEAAFRMHVPLDVCVEHLDRLGHGYAQEGGKAGYELLVSMLFGDYGCRHRALSRIVSTLIVAVSVAVVDGFEHPLLRYRVDLSPAARAFLGALHALVRETVLRGPEVTTTAMRNMDVVTTLFDGAMRGAVMLPVRSTPLTAPGSDTPERTICDRIAVLSDREAIGFAGDCG